MDFAAGKSILGSSLTSACLKLLHPFSTPSLLWVMLVPCPGRGHRWQCPHTCKSLAVLKSKFLLMASLTQKVGQALARFPWAEHLAYSYSSSAPLSHLGKAFQQGDTKGKNDPACFGRSCWQLPAEAGKGRDHAGISSPCSLRKLVHTVNFRPMVVLQSPTSWGWIWLQKEQPPLFWTGGWSSCLSILQD